MNALLSPNMQHTQPGGTSGLASHLEAGAVFLTIQHPPSMKL